MTFNDLLRSQNIDPKRVLVLRHRPPEPELRKVLPWLAAEKPDVFNAYQQTQSPKLEGAMQSITGSGWIASFIGHEPGKAIFVGLYAIEASTPMSHDEYWRVPAYIEMKAFGMRGWSQGPDGRTSILWFDLHRVEFYSSWQGKLIIDWPPPELAWWRRAHRNDMIVRAILEESAFAAAMPAWSDLDLSWADLGVLPGRWRSALSQWRAIYYIFDQSDGKGYVGSAYGSDNLLGRWRGYAAKGHGGNVLLRKRDPQNFRFTILERVSPDLEAADVIRLESSWKQRLHTRVPHGLNDN